MPPRQQLGRNIYGWIERRDQGDVLVIEVPLEWDGENLTKSRFKSIARTFGPKKLVFVDDNGDILEREERLSLSVWGGPKQKGKIDGF